MFLGIPKWCQQRRSSLRNKLLRRHEQSRSISETIFVSIFSVFLYPIMTPSLEASIWYRRQYARILNPTSLHEYWMITFRRRLETSDRFLQLVCFYLWTFASLFDCPWSCNLCKVRGKRGATIDEDGAVSLSLLPFSLVDTFLNVGGRSGKRESAAEDGSLSSVRFRGCNRASSRPYSDQMVSGLFCMYLHHDWPLLLPSGHWSNSQSSKSCLSFI